MTKVTSPDDLAFAPGCSYQTVLPTRKTIVSLLNVFKLSAHADFLSEHEYLKAYTLHFAAHSVC